MIIIVIQILEEFILIVCENLEIIRLRLFHLYWLGLSWNLFGLQIRILCTHWIYCRKYYLSAVVLIGIQLINTMRDAKMSRQKKVY
jgi:hypothetical protein